MATTYTTTSAVPNQDECEYAIGSGGAISIGIFGLVAAGISIYNWVRWGEVRDDLRRGLLIVPVSPVNSQVVTTSTSVIVTESEANTLYWLSIIFFILSVILVLYAGYLLYKVNTRPSTTVVAPTVTSVVGAHEVKYYSVSDSPSQSRQSIIAPTNHVLRVHGSAVPGVAPA